MNNPISECIQLIRAIQRAKREGRTEELLRAAKEKAEIHRLMIQPSRQETINGTGETGWGAAMLCFALSSYSCVVLPKSAWRIGVSWLFLLCACVAMPLVRWAIRKYVTWPRTGYVVYRRGFAFWIGIVVAMVVAAVGSLYLSRLMGGEIAQFSSSQALHRGLAGNGAAARDASSWGALSHTAKLILCGMGPLNALLYLMMNAVSIKEHRWKWPLLVILVLGPFVICSFVPGNYIEVSRPVMLFLGLVCLGSGLATLIWYMRHTPAPVTEAA